MRALLLSAVVLALVAAGCGSDGTDELSDPAVRPGTVGADTGLAVAEPGEAEAPVEAPVETPPTGGFVLDLPEGSLPTGPPPTGDDEGAIGAAPAPTDVAFVQRSIETVAEQRYRFEMRFAMSADGAGESFDISPAEPIATGAADGTRQRTLVDLGVLFDAMTAELGADLGDLGELTALFGDDLGVETIIDGTVIYLRAPMLGMLGAFGGAGLPTELGELGDGWGMVDLATVPGVSADDIAALTGAQSGSTPDQILAMLDDLGTLTEVGPATIDGDAVTQYRTVVDIEALLAAEAAELEALGPAITDDVGAMFGDGPVIELFIDADGNLRRLAMTIDGNDPAGQGAFSVSTTIDMFDHGGDITIDTPDDAVDLTDVFAQLAALGDGPIWGVTFPNRAPTGLRTVPVSATRHADEPPGPVNPPRSRSRAGRS